MADRASDLVGQIREALGKVNRQLELLSQFDGAQNTRAIAKLQELIDGILTQVNGVFSGYISAGGDATIGGNINLAGSIFSAYSASTPVVNSYSAAYWDGVSKRLGITPSSLRFKQDIEPADTTALVDALRHLALVRFRYIEAVEQHGEAARWELGSLAEYAAVAGLAEFVYNDDEGKPLGINYERLTIPLIAAFQSVDARLTALENAQSQTT